MSLAQSYATPLQQAETGKVLSIRSLKRDNSSQESEIKVSFRETKRYELHLTKDKLPLTVQYDDKTYVLVLTKSNKLLLQKPIN